MEHLILVRHGHDVDDRISQQGRSQIDALCERLAPVIGGKNVLVLSSPTGRATGSAEMLATRFDAVIQLYEVLWSENDHPMNLKKALEVVREHGEKADALVVVTHYEYVKDFPEYFGRQVLGVSFPNRLIDKGRAWVIDVAEKKIQCY